MKFEEREKLHSELKEILGVPLIFINMVKEEPPNVELCMMFWISNDNFCFELIIYPNGNNKIELNHAGAAGGGYVECTYQEIIDVAKEYEKAFVGNKLPYSVWEEANHQYQHAPTDIEIARHHCSPPLLTKSETESIAEELQTDPVIVTLLQNLPIMFACGDIDVDDRVTEVIGKFVNIEYWDYVDHDIYKIKPEYEKYFPRCEEEDEAD